MALFHRDLPSGGPLPRVLPGGIAPRNIPTAPQGSVPFALPQTLVTGMRMGLGRLFNVTAMANTDTTITHYLGRIPHFVLPLDNGTNYVPQVKRSTVTAWTTANVTVQFSAAMAGWVWVV